MKEATGELNTTIIVVLAVGVLMAFFYYTLWPIIRTNFDNNSKCSKAICEPCKDENGKSRSDCETVKCHLSDSNEMFECVYKG